MFERAHGNDPVELARDLAVIQQLEAHVIL